MVDPSLAYEIIVYLNSFHCGLLAFVELGVFVYKSIKLGKCYNPDIIIHDGLLLLTTFVLEALRIYLGRKGSLSNRNWQVIVSVVLILPCMAGILFIIFWQRVMIYLERILCTLELILLIAESFYATVFAFTTCGPPTYG